MRFPLAILTLLSTLLTLSLTLALPNPTSVSEVRPQTTETITLITSLANVGLNAIKLDRAVRSFTDNVDEIKTLSANLEHSINQAISTTKSTGNLDTPSSHIIAGICVPLKPIFADMLKAISNKKRDFFRAHYGDDMLQTLTSLRIKSRSEAKALKDITRELDGAFILFLEDLVDKQFAMTIAEYKMKGIDGGNPVARW